MRYWGRGLRQTITLDWLPGRRLIRRPPKATFLADGRAGLSVALLAFSQSIAYSVIAGLPPVHGLISSGIGAITAPFFSGTRFIVVGPTNATAVLLLTGLAATGLPEAQRLAALPLFVLLVGFFMVLGALAKASLLINYISRTVITGYVTAAAAFILVNQVPGALGFRLEGATTFLGVVAGVIRALPNTMPTEVAMSAGTLAVMLGLRRWAPKVPEVATTLAVMAVMGLGFTWVGWDVGTLGRFALADLGMWGAAFEFNLVGALAAPALALAFVSVLEGMSVGKTLASRAGQRLDVNQEMYAMGVANVACAFTGGMNASGSLTRSVLADGSGARSPMATVYSGVIVLLLAVFLGYFVGFIPRAALAVVVMGIALSLFNRRNLLLALRTTRSDAVVFLVTAGSALLLTIDAAIYLGAFTSIILFLKKAGTTELVEYNFTDDGQLAALPDAAKRSVPGISILHAEGDLFFGSTDIFAAQIREVMRDPSLQVIILRLKNARNLDATAAAGIEELHDFLKKGGRHLIVSGADREVSRVVRNSGLLERLGEANFFREDPANPTLSTRHALKRAVEVLGRRDAAIRIFIDPAKQEKKGEE